MVTRNVGIGSIRSQFQFIHINLNNHSKASMLKLLGNVLRLASSQIADKTVTMYTAFFEDAFKDVAVSTEHTYVIPGNINWLSVLDVESVLNEKIKHSAPEYRKKGMVSTHPPKFLTPETLVIVIGSTKFLLRNMQLYLEQEGILRDKTFDLLVDIACLEVARGRKRDDFLHVFIQDETWYQGNVEALGDFVSKNHKKDPSIMSDEQLFKRLSQSP